MSAEIKLTVNGQAQTLSSEGERSLLDYLREDLHLTERFRRVNQNTLEIEFTFDDPKTFTKPWTGKKVFQLQPPGFEMKEHVICEEYRKLGLRKEGYEFIFNKQ